MIKTKKVFNKYSQIFIKIFFYFSLFFINFYFCYFQKETILSIYKKEQKEFCINIKKFYNQSIEKKLELLDIKINKLEFKMFVPHKNEKHPYKKYHNFEKKESLNFIISLRYYSKKKKIIKNKDIFILDIGGNIGWYPSLLGRYGYTILTFEPDYNNYYVIRKNYCYLNKKSNVIIITKGLNNEEKTCNYYIDSLSLTNGMTLCNNNNVKNKVSKRFIKTKTVKLTKLSNFIPYLYNKNVALIKIDIEGSEGIVIENGIELITKFHVPFIFIEFTPKLLMEHKTNPKNFIQLFLNNGYKISIEGFLTNNYISIEDLLKKVKYQINIYLIYTNFLT